MVVVVALVGAAAAVEAVGVGRRLPVGEVGAVPAAADAPGHARLFDGLYGGRYGDLKKLRIEGSLMGP